MDEFQLIQEFFGQRIKSHRPDVALGIGDDCAVLEITAGQQLVVSIDTLVAGVHFPHSTNAYDIGYKSLAVNLSDLAAMAATPTWATLALTLPALDKEWLQQFSDGFFALAEQFGVELIGGDTTRGPLTISMQAHGIVPTSQGVARSGAKPGDLIYVTNTLGDAGFGLKLIQSGTEIHNPSHRTLIERLNRPYPRVKEGLLLRGIASAMIDISDGLVADLGHILERSKVGAELQTDHLPICKALHSIPQLEALKLALTAGDDYELCFTIPEEKQTLLEQIMKANHVHVTQVGKINSSCQLSLMNGQGQKLDMQDKGYLHFN